MTMQHGGPRPTERAFGTSVGTVLAGIGLWLAIRGRTMSGGALVAIGMLLVGAGLVAPAVLRVPNRLWWSLALVLGWVNSRILLTAFYATVMTPVGVVMRALGRNPLRPPEDHTTWQAAPARRANPKHYDRMF